MAGVPDLSTLRGVRTLGPTIQGWVARGFSQSDVIDLARGLITANGGRWTSASARAVANRYAQFQARALKAQALAHVRGSIAITPAWISYSTLARPIPAFNEAPKYHVQYLVSGEVEGEKIRRWQTAVYEGEGMLPGTVSELRSDLQQTAATTYEEMLSGIDFSVSEVAIYAV